MRLALWFWWGETFWPATVVMQSEGDTLSKESLAKKFGNGACFLMHANFEHTYTQTPIMEFEIIPVLLILSAFAQFQS